MASYLEIQKWFDSNTVGYEVKANNKVPEVYNDDDDDDVDGLEVLLGNLIELQLPHLATRGRCLVCWTCCLLVHVILL